MYNFGTFKILPPDRLEAFENRAHKEHVHVPVGYYYLKVRDKMASWNDEPIKSFESSHVGNYDSGTTFPFPTFIL